MKTETTYVIRTDGRERVIVKDKKEALAKWNHLRATELRDPQTLDFVTHRLYRREEIQVRQ